jgi:ATP-binding cassette subfamily F protein 2
MVSDASKKKAAQKKAAAAAKRGDKAKAAITLSERTCTAVLTSHPLSRDIHIESLSLTFHGHDLLLDTDLELNYGR